MAPGRPIDPEDRVAMFLAVVIALVLVVIVVDLTLASAMSATDRAATLAALAAIGSTLAYGLARWIGYRSEHRDRDD